MARNIKCLDCGKIVDSYTEDFEQHTCDTEETN